MRQIIPFVGRRRPRRLFRHSRVIITRPFLQRGSHGGRWAVSHRGLLLTLVLIDGSHQHLMSVDHPYGLLGCCHLVGSLLLGCLGMLVSHKLGEWGLSRHRRYLICCTFVLLLDQVLGGNLDDLLRQFLLLFCALGIGGQV